MTIIRGRNVLRLLAVLLSFTLVAAACSDDSEDGSVETADEDGTDEGGTDEGDTNQDDTDQGDADTDQGDADTDTDADPISADEPLTASFKGVSETTITVGVTMLDFEFLVSSGLSKAGWGGQQAVWEALIADLNNRGGINGRNVEAVYDFYSAIDPADADRACVALTQDNNLFAVLGGFVGPAAGTVDPCITGLNNTILVGGDQNDDELAQSNAPWYQPGQAANASTEILLNLLGETGALDGAQVFVIGGLADEAAREPTLAALADRGIAVVGDDTIIAPDGDVAAQDSELQIITERVRDSGATAVFIHGNPASAIRGLGAAGLNTELDIWSNNPGGLNNLGATLPDKSVANGVITAAGPDDDSIWNDPDFQSECVDVVAAALPEADIRDPEDYAEDEENWFNSIRRYCRHLDLFVQIATAAGNELTQDSFVAGAETLGDFSLPGSPAASLSSDKLYAEDRFALAEYDSTAGDGMAIPIGEFIDVFP